MRKTLSWLCIGSWKEANNQLGLLMVQQLKRVTRGPYLQVLHALLKEDDSHLRLLALLSLCLYGRRLDFQRWLALSAEILLSGLTSYEITFYLYERRAGTPSWGLAIEQLRSPLAGLESFHLNTIKRAGLTLRARNNGAKVSNAL